ncbi:alpha/beta hydrolase [Telluribacter sp.]|jgi:pimeloyl-ACP methyl ester carboxylesterase|uniref:alpha/beta fold hydrolase n=1 Tax=Telluribacter sp. TaxID=1978767 RepID=UPI002E1061FC|nr:alpha/beta hydrolase [Telluribacter sp.]
MKHLLLLFLLLTAARAGLAQKVDSVRYDHGYLYVKEFGQGEPIIMLSGGPGLSAANQEAVAQALGKQYRCILLDQRGTGRSVPDSLTTATINLRESLSDLNRLLDHLRLKSALFYGYSWGGTLALAYATSYPDRVKALLLVGPGIICHDPRYFRIMEDNQTVRLGMSERNQRDSLLTRAAQKGMTAGMEKELLRLNILSNIYDKNRVDEIAQEVTRSTFNARVQELMLFDLARTGFDLTDKLPRLPPKVAIITGRQDPLAFLSENTQHLLPKSAIVWLDKCGHFPMFEQPRAFYLALESAVKELL